MMPLAVGGQSGSFPVAVATPAVRPVAPSVLSGESHTARPVEQISALAPGTRPFKSSSADISPVYDNPALSITSLKAPARDDVAMSAHNVSTTRRSENATNNVNDPVPAQNEGATSQKPSDVPDDTGASEARSRGRDSGEGSSGATVSPVTPVGQEDQVGQVSDGEEDARTSPNPSVTAEPSGLDPEEKQLVSELAARDREVRIHELQHQVVGGQYAGAASFSYKTGPDGVQYAVSGEVSISVSEVPNNPQATIEKMRTVRAAALAPAEPSAQDRAVAAQASRLMLKAQAELTRQQAEARQRLQAEQADRREKVAERLSEASGSAEETRDRFSQSVRDNAVFLVLGRVYEHGAPETPNLLDVIA